MIHTRYKLWSRYQIKHQGSAIFQIDLGLTMINYGTSMDWDGKSKDSNWIQQGEFTTCVCESEECYFCLNGFTLDSTQEEDGDNYGICICNKQVKTEECSVDQVNLRQGSKYCKIYYRKQVQMIVNHQDWVVFSVRNLFVKLMEGVVR